MQVCCATRLLPLPPHAPACLPSARRRRSYVTGLPEDVTEAEMVETFSKCGVIKEDLEVGGHCVFRLILFQ